MLYVSVWSPNRFQKNRRCCLHGLPKPFEDIVRKLREMRPY